MARRTSPLLYLGLFLVPFGVGAGVGYTFESSRASKLVDVVASSIPDTTADTGADTVAAVETTIADTTEAAPTTEQVTVPTTSEPPTTEATIMMPSAPRDGSGAFLVRPADTNRTLYDPGVGCASLVPEGVTATSCDLGSSGPLQVAWISGGSTLYVLTHAEDDGPDVWNLVLRGDGNPSRSPVMRDVTGDGIPDLVASWRTGDTLEVDVVQFDSGSAEVSLHLSLLNGRVIVGDGRLDAWQAVMAEGSSVPATFVHWAYRGGPGWSVDASRDDDPPQGQL